MGHIYCAGSRIQAEGDKEYDEQRPDETATDKTDDSEKLRNLQTDYQYAKNSNYGGNHAGIYFQYLSVLILLISCINRGKLFRIQTVRFSAGAVHPGITVEISSFGQKFLTFLTIL